jgi:HlyD family secretion protein
LTVSQRALRGDLGAGLFTRERMVAAALGVLAVLLAFLIVHDVLFPPAATLTSQRSVPVSVGNVRSVVSGTGTVVPMTQQNLSFGQTGQLTEVDVKVGDHVTAAQTLAKIDPTLLQQALDQANNNLTQAQATLNSTLNGNAVTQAQHSLANAQQSLTDAQAQVNLTNQQDANAVANDQSQLSNDQGQLSTDQNSAPYTNLSKDQGQLSKDQQSFDTTCRPAAPADVQTCTALAQDIQVDQQRIQQDQTAVNADNAKIASDQSRLTSDQNKQAADQVSNQKTLDSANAAVVTAQDSLNSQTVQRPNTIASQQAQVANDQLAVQTAQRNLNQATLTAPYDATILSINGQVGETVSAGAGTTAQAPGTTAPQPSSSGATASGASGSGGGASGGFITLGNVSGLEVVAPFAEADAARLAANQQATITFDAVANLSVPAHVLAVASGATVISNVTNYYATLIVDRLDQRLRSGMTANASVVVQQVSGVLTLPNSAITRLGTGSFVALLGKNGTTVRQPVQTGTVGDSTTEIVSGLNQGDRVVLPQLRTTTGAAGGGRGAGGFGGGGGAVRIGGGG